MFTGIIIELGKVQNITKHLNGARLSILSKNVIRDALVGDSISVNGVCLTVTDIEKTRGLLFFDVSHETLQKTTLGDLKRNDLVNLEPALTLNTKLGGHIVSGHVEAVGTIKNIENIGDYINLEIEAPKEVLRYCIKKGSIAIDGISLTIVDIFPTSFTVVIVPHTAKMTTISKRKVGDRVNLESDLIAKYVEKFIIGDSSSREDRLMVKLREQGFI